MTIDMNYTDYESEYNKKLRTESERAYSEALAAARAEQAGKTAGVVQTGNTGPVESAQEIKSEENRFESAEAYLEYLQLQFSDSIFTLGDFRGEASELSGIGSIMLSPKLLEKMLDDPEFRYEMEKTIADIDESEKSLRSWYEANNSKVLGHGAVIDAEGQAKTWSFILEDLNSMDKLGSTSSFMKLEELREKTMKMDL